MRKLILAFFCGATVLSALSAQDLETGKYLYRTHQVGDYVLNYRILYPEGFDASERYPVVVFLHGRGESGTDNEKQLTHGSQLFVDHMDDYPAIVVFPQCPEDDYWANLSRPEQGGATRQFAFYTEGDPKPALGATISLIDELLAEGYTDDNRLYVTGLSMGGMGTWELLWRMPEKIAAAVPICGGGATNTADMMVDVPIWAIHGVRDDVVHPRYTIRMVKAVQRAGGRAKISLYPNANHNSWDPTFADPDYLRWLFKHSKKNTTRK